VHAGNVFSLVKRTLFEANSKACRFGRESLTSVLTGRLLLASPRTVNPGAPNIALKPGLGSHAKTAGNFLSPFCKTEEESDPLLAVARPCFMRKGGMNGENPLARPNPFAKRNQPVNDNDERPVTIITGRVWKKKGGKPEGVHVMLVAPDDDSAVRRTLESLAAEGYAEVELDQIGDMDGAPDDEPHLSAFQGALEGEVSIVTFDVPI